MPQPQANMLAPCSVPQTLPLRAANQQGRSMGTTWHMARAQRVLELEQFVLFFPTDRVLLGVVRTVQRHFGPLGLGDIAVHQRSATTTRQVLADVAAGLTFASAIRIEQKRDLAKPHAGRAGRDIHQHALRVTPHGVPFRLDHHFRPDPQSPAHYLFAAVDTHLHFNSAEALGDFCTRHGLVEYVAGRDAREHLVAKTPRLSLADIRHPRRVL